jgi:hypothetical protein
MSNEEQAGLSKYHFAAFGFFPGQFHGLFHIIGFLPGRAHPLQAAHGPSRELHRLQSRCAPFPVSALPVPDSYSLCHVRPGIKTTGTLKTVECKPDGIDVGRLTVVDIFYTVSLRPVPGGALHLQTSRRLSRICSFLISDARAARAVAIPLSGCVVRVVRYP